MSKADKQYGLIIPKKQQISAPRATNIFADDNPSDEEDGTDWVKKALKAESEKNKLKKQTKLSMQKALQEDPTIYQYDEVYDDMERTKNQTKATVQEQKKPKYIQNLLKAAERRKKEQEHRIERMVQKEREAEGTMYADKESFVTSAYRAKLEEFKKMEEEESRMSRLEAIGDVTKQQDISGFYRHLYEQTVENPKQSEDTSDATKPEISTEDLCDSKESDITVNPTKDTKVEQPSPTKPKRSRQYRQRVIEEEEDSDKDESTEFKKPNEVQSKDETQLPKNVKALNKQDIQEPENKKSKQDTETPKVDDDKATSHNTPNLKDLETRTENTNNNINIEKSDASANELKEKFAAEKKEKSRIWEKRTVGPVFEAALQRYYERKAIRLSAG